MTSRSRVPEHVAVSGWRLAVLLVVGTATASSPFGVNAHIPTTLLVDEAGLVERIWFGVPEEEAQQELLGLLG